MDPFDPTTWAIEPRTITLDWTGDHYAIVDACDYDTVMRFNTWCLKPSKHTAYARTYKWEGGHRYPIFLHRVVMLLTGKEPPTPAHTIVDHINGNGLDCRRINLRWATSSMNNKNMKGSMHREELIRQLAQSPVQTEVSARAPTIHEAALNFVKQRGASTRCRQPSPGCSKSSRSPTSERVPSRRLPRSKHSACEDQEAAVTVFHAAE